MRRPCFWFGLVLLLLTAGIRLAYVMDYGASVGIDDFAVEDTDSYARDRWARSLANGDWLLRAPYHPYPEWARWIAPEDQWLEWYGGAEVYPFAPLYPYCLGVLYRIPDGGPLLVRIVQALLGAGTGLLIFLLGRQYFGRYPAVIAGLLYLFSGFYFFYDAFYYPEGLTVFLTCAFLFVVERAARKKRLGALLLGALLLGCDIATTPGALVLIPLLGIVAVLVLKRGRLLGGAVGLLMLLLALAAPLSPFCARNAVLHLPLFKLTAQGPTAFINGNARGQQETGWAPAPGQTRNLLMESNYNLSATMIHTLKTWVGSPLSYLRLLHRKACAVFEDRGIHHPVDYPLVRCLSRTLSWGFIPFGFLSAAALLGMMLLLPLWDRVWILYAALILLALSLILFYVSDSGRLPLVPLFAIFGGYGAHWLFKKAWKRRWAALLPACLLLALLLSWTLRKAGSDLDTEQVYLEAAWELAAQEKFDHADDFRKKWLALTAASSENRFYPSEAEKFQETEKAFAQFEAMEAHAQEEAVAHLYKALGFLHLLKALPPELSEPCLSKANQAARTADALDPDLPGVKRTMGLVLKEQAMRRPRHEERIQDLAKSAAFFRAELEKDPDDPESNKWLGFCHENFGNLDEAIQYYKIYLRKQGDWDFPMAARICSILLNQPELEGEKLDLCLSLSRGAYEHNRNDLKYCRNYSVALYRAGKKEEAARIVEEMKKLDPQGAEEYNLRINTFRSGSGKDAGEAGIDTEESETDSL